MDALGTSVAKFPSSTFSVTAAKEKSMEKKYKQGRYKCKKLDYPLKLRCNSTQPIKTHWKKTHGVESNSDKDFCNHCGNYMYEDDPCNFLDPCPREENQTKERVLERLKKLYYEEKEAKEKEMNEKAKNEKKKNLD